MLVYHFIKKLITKRVLSFQERLIEFNSRMNSRKYVKKSLSKVEIPKLTRNQVRAAKDYYKARG
ncbi:hypothetical protein WPG_3392 [Winogradskyella sp. PG-2]|nr:hypothetical protein WPG_3392 [Winogradskyella sp. PG-2]